METAPRPNPRFPLALFLAFGQGEGRGALGDLRLDIGLVAAIAVAVPIAVAGLLLLQGLLLLVLLQLGLLGGHDAVIMFGMLEIVLRHDAVARRVGVAGKLEVLLVDIAAEPRIFTSGPEEIERPVRIVDIATSATAAAIVMTAAACVLRPAAAST